MPLALFQQPTIKNELAAADAPHHNSATVKPIAIVSPFASHLRLKTAE